LNSLREEQGQSSESTVTQAENFKIQILTNSSQYDSNFGCKCMFGLGQMSGLNALSTCIVLKKKQTSVLLFFVPRTYCASIDLHCGDFCTEREVTLCAVYEYVSDLYFMTICQSRVNQTNIYFFCGER